jgi:hypothetical protein
LGQRSADPVVFRDESPRAAQVARGLLWIGDHESITKPAETASMSQRTTRRNLRPMFWLGLSVVGFAAALALGNAALALFASLAIVGALLSVQRYPRIRD